MGSHGSVSKGGKTFDGVSVLRNGFEFSKTFLVFRWGYGNKQKVFYCFHKKILKTTREILNIKLLSSDKL